jgi:copper chaperone CopZ
MGTKQSDVVLTSFTLDTPSFSTEDTFSYPLVISEITNTDSRVQTFSSLDAVQDAGYTSGNVFKFATAFFGQTGRKGGKASILKVGKKPSNANCTQTVVFDADATAGTFTLTLGAETTAGIAYDGNAAAVKAALEALTAITEVTVTLNTGAAKAGDAEGFTVAFTGADASTDFAALVAGIGSLTSVTTATVTKTIYGSAVETWGTAYTAIKASDTGFYFVIADVNAALESTLDTLPALVEADNRQLWLVTKTADAKTSAATDIGSTMYGRFGNTYLFYSGDYDNYSLASCVLGKCIPDFFGATNPSYAPLALITADSLTDGEIGYLIGKRYARCESLNSFACIMGTSSGSTSLQGVKSTMNTPAKSMWIKHYLEYVVSNALVDLLQKNVNVYFSQEWFDVIESVIYTTLETKGVDQGLLVADSIEIIMPDLTTYDTTKKLNEFLDGVTADSEKTNPISKIRITGKIK